MQGKSFTKLFCKRRSTRPLQYIFQAIILAPAYPWSCQAQPCLRIFHWLFPLCGVIFTQKLKGLAPIFIHNFWSLIFPLRPALTSAFLTPLLSLYLSLLPMALSFLISSIILLFILYMLCATLLLYSITIFLPGMHACNFSTWGSEAGGSLLV